jgi:putative transposase
MANENDLVPSPQFPPDVIRHAVWLYFRFTLTLSFRDVEDLLAERRLDVSYETVRVGC